MNFSLSSSQRAAHEMHAPSFVLADETILQLNNKLVISAFDDTSTNRSLLYELADKNGRSRRVTVTAVLHKHLQLFMHQVTFQQVREQLISDGMDEEQLSYLKEVIETKLLPRKILLLAADVHADAPALPSRPSYMAVKVPLLRPGLVNLLSAPLTWLFSKSALPLALLMALAGQIYFYALTSAQLTSSFMQLESINIIWIFFWVALGMVAHELGHASAGYRYGCRHMEIGVGWYIYFMVFYADLSEAWRCKRSERAIIDTAGMYFQAMYTSALMAVYWINPNPSLFYAALLLNFALLWNLNPFFRLDGYWLASDLMGVANLRKTSTATFRQLIQRMLGRAVRPNNHLASLKTPIQRWLILYTIASSLFFCWLFYWITTQLIWVLLQRIPDYYLSMWYVLTSGGRWPDVLVSFIALLWHLLIFGFVVRFLLSSSKKLLQLKASLRKPD